MKFTITLIMFLAMLIDPTKIGKINTLKSDAREAFENRNYKEAIKKFNYLIDSLNVDDDALKLNRAHAYYLLKDTANAKPAYEALVQSPVNEIRSKSLLQLGLMTNSIGKSEEALQQFKQSVKANPKNKLARYNYEMLKKKLEEKRKEDEKKKQDQKNKDENKNQEPSAYAKKLKAEADKLVGEKHYKEAYDLMANGLKKDKTVSHYQEYITRIKDVSEITK